MKTYTEEQLIKAVEYACGYQKASDYQTAGSLLIKEYETVEEAHKAIVSLLDDLADCENNSLKEITIEDIEEYLTT